jgi:solute:Na+ symporter, SSS family
MVVLAATDLRLDTNWVDFLLIAIYFVFVLGIGVMARRSVSSSLTSSCRDARSRRG